MYISNFGEKENNNIALFRLTHLVVNDAHLGASGSPLGCQWQANGNTVATHQITTMAKNGFSTGYKWVT